MKNITMESKILRVNKVHKKTKAKFFQNLIEGDEIKFSSVIESVGTSRGRSYAVYIKVKNIKTGEYTHNTYNDMVKRLKNFELEEKIG